MYCPTRYALTVFPDTMHISKPAEDSGLGLRCPQERFRTSGPRDGTPLCSFSQEEWEKRKMLEAVRLQRRRNNEARVEEAYRREEFEKSLHEEARILAKGRQKLRYVEACEAIDAFRNGRRRNPTAASTLEDSSHRQENVAEETAPPPVASSAQAPQRGVVAVRLVVLVSPLQLHVGRGRA